MGRAVLTGRTSVLGSVVSVPLHAPTHAPAGTDALTVDAAAGTGSFRTLGTGAQQAAGGTDSRLSDVRTPADGSVTDAMIASTLSPSKITGTAVVTADSRLSDARAPVLPSWAPSTTYLAGQLVLAPDGLTVLERIAGGVSGGSIDYTQWNAVSDSSNLLIPMVFNPGAIINPGAAATIATGSTYLSRTIVPRAGVLHDLNMIIIAGASGNVQGAIYGIDNNGSRQWKWNGTSKSTNQNNKFLSLGDPALAVSAFDQLEFAFQIDNATATVGRIASTTTFSGQLPASFISKKASSALPKVMASATSGHDASTAGNVVNFAFGTWPAFFQEADVSIEIARNHPITFARLDTS